MKSYFQFICGDLNGAIDTQKKFYSKCPIVAQFKSFCELIDGEIGKALRTQKEFFRFWFDTAVTFAEGCVTGCPGVGHIIGKLFYFKLVIFRHYLLSLQCALAYIAGKKEYGNQCMRSASRTAGVILGALVGTFFGGPVGAAIGAVGGGAVMDLLITGIESTIRDQYSPSGYLAALDAVLKGEKYRLNSLHY